MPQTHSSDYVESWYNQARIKPEFTAVLSQDIETETCVIGGGMAGISTALGLAERGKKAVLLEAHKIGWGASGRNGGFVSTGYSLGSTVIIKKIGMENAQRLHALTEDAFDLIKKRIGDFEIDCGPIIEGCVGPSLWNNDGEIREEIEVENKNFKGDYEFWSREKVQSHYNTKVYQNAVFNPKQFQVHPLNMTLGMAEAAVKLGVQVFEDSPVLSLKKYGDRIKVETKTGSVIANNVVLCCSGYIGKIYPSLGLSTVPITTYVMVTEPLGERMAEMSELPYCVSDERMACDYYRPLPDGSTRLLWGGRITAFPAKPENVADIMRGCMLRIYPHFEDVKIEMSWSGVMGYSSHRMPVIGKLADNVWCNTNHGGHGMATTTTGGEVLARAIAEGDETYKLFEPFGRGLPSGPFGPIAAQALYFWDMVKNEWVIRNKLF